MFNPAALFIGMRYTRAKRRNSFISFISLVSMIGIALGVTVLITVLSVMNGFDKEIRSRVFSLVPALTISSNTGSIIGWEDLQVMMRDYPLVEGSAPYVAGEVLLNYGGSSQASYISGILPEQEKSVTELADKMIEGQLSDLKPGGFGIVLGAELANELGVVIGDKVTLMTPQVSVTPAGALPRFKRFTVVGVFKAGSGFNFDKGMSFINLYDAQKLQSIGANVTGLHLKLKNVYAAPAFAKQLRNELTGTAVISTWADQFEAFFHAVQLEKTMMFLMLLLIIAVAAFNLVATLVMVVNEKQADIAILRTFGATPRMVMSIFIVQGGIVGVIGTAMGLVGGLLLAFNVTSLFKGIEYLFNVQLMSSNVYFVDYLPSDLMWSDVVKVCTLSLILSLSAVIYPAWRASRIEPVEALRYE